MAEIRALKQAARMVVHGIPADNDERVLGEMMNVTPEDDAPAAPITDRPPPKERAKKGVKAAQEVVVPQEEQQPAPTHTPTPDAPKQATAAEILAEADAKAAKTRQDEADAKANLNAEAQEARGRGAVEGDKRANSSPQQVTQRALLHDGEVLVVEAQIDAYKLVTGTRSGQPWPYVTADIVSPELRGQVSMTDGAVIDGQPIPAWQLDQPVRLTIKGKKYKNGSLVNVVEKIEVIQGGVSGEPGAASDDV